MDRLTNIFLIFASLWIAVQAVGLIFFYDLFDVPYFAINLDSEILNEFRHRTVMPAFYITLLYFVVRYFSGRNPTSPIWPIFVAYSAWTITLFISFFTIGIHTINVTFFIITIIGIILVRRAHNKRKNEIF
tara:strand:- start:530 stop:922 length:393 start_codon:yes stop_codon:yes gene_type:complete